MAIHMGDTDRKRERGPRDPGRDVVIAGCDVAVILWTPSYAGLCADGPTGDIRTASERGIVIVVLRLEGAPSVPAGLFPPGTRIADVQRDPESGAAAIRRIVDEGWDHLPLLAPSSPEGPDSA